MHGQVDPWGRLRGCGPDALESPGRESRGLAHEGWAACLGPPQHWFLAPRAARGHRRVGLLLLSLFLLAGTSPVAGQGVVDRTPNLEGGWTGSPGALTVHVVHRFWRVGPGTDDKLVNSPTMLLGLPMGPDVLVGGRYASNSLLAADRFNEWELFGRWARQSGPFHLAASGAWNSAAQALDAEVSATSSPRGSSSAEGSSPSRLRVLTAWRLHQAGEETGGTGWSVAGGAVLRLSENVSAAADLGRRRMPATSRSRTWGAGVQLRIPASPHTLSIQATNTRTSTLRGSATPDRTVWGFEFTMPLTPARYLPGRRSGPQGATPGATPSEGADPEVVMTDLAFVPDTLRVRSGTQVRWTNTSELVHTVTAHPDRVRDPGSIKLPEGAEPFDSGNLFPGETFVWRFETPGVYRYLCIPHATVGMIGVVIVDP